MISRNFICCFSGRCRPDVLLLSVIAVVAIVSMRRLPLVAFGIAWFFIQMLPTSLIPRNDLLSERNLYLPVIGLLLAIVSLGWHLVQWLLVIVRRPALVRIGSAVLATALIVVAMPLHLPAKPALPRPILALV